MATIETKEGPAVTATASIKDDGSLSLEDIAKMERSFSEDPKNKLAQNVVARTDLREAALSPAILAESNHLYSLKLSSEGPATSQASSGRCWLFAALNCLRLPFAKKMKIKTNFEFSQNYLFFWDKFEKANYFLESIIETAHLSVDSRLLAHLLHMPVNDGGQYEMFKSLVAKYGLVPKKVYPDTFHSGMSQPVNWIVTYRLRAAAADIRQQYRAGAKVDELRQTKQKVLEEIHRILSISLGEPPKTFDWVFPDKDGKQQKLMKLTPQRFATDSIVDLQLQDNISLIHDPRNPYFATYTVEYLGNVVGGSPVLYLNLPIEQLKKYAIASLKKDQAVWFGCDVGKFLHRTTGLLDVRVFDYSLLLGSDKIHPSGLSKADRLRYGESLMTHAMVFTAVDLSEEWKEEETQEGKSLKWRVENSWGSKDGDGGYLSMHDTWFDEYVYQIVVQKSLLSEEHQALLVAKPPTVLPAWDPMGALA